MEQKRKMDRKAISKFVKEGRNRKGLSLLDLAEATGVSRMHVHHIENCKRDPSINFFFRLCKALGYRLHLTRVQDTKGKGKG